MRSRIEPRLSTETPGTYTVIREASHRQHSCTITDVSSLGYSLDTAETIQPGELIQLQLSGAQVLVAVRHCRRTADGYRVGVERVDEWTSSSETAAEGAHGPTSSMADRQKPLGRPKVNYLDRVSIAAARLLFASVRHSQAQDAGYSTIRGAGRFSRVKIAFVCSVMLVLGVAAVFHGRSPAAPRGAVANVFPPSSLAVQVDRRADGDQPSASPKPVARLESDFAAARPPIPTTPSASTPPLTPGAEKPRLQGTSMTNSAPDEARTATHYRKVTFKAHGNSWVLACVDGRKLFERLFQNGDSAELPFSSQALLHSGNAGALEIEIDSSPVGSMGETGAARTWQFSGNGGGVDISTKYHHTCDTY